MSHDQSQSLFPHELASTERQPTRRAREKRKNRSFFKGGAHKQNRGKRPQKHAQNMPESPQNAPTWALNEPGHPPSANSTFDTAASRWNNASRFPLLPMGFP
jgi:hypothetical protein